MAIILYNRKQLLDGKLWRTKSSSDFIRKTNSVVGLFFIQNISRGRKWTFARHWMLFFVCRFFLYHEVNELFIPHSTFQSFRQPFPAVWLYWRKLKGGRGRTLGKSWPLLCDVNRPFSNVNERIISNLVSPKIGLRKLVMKLAHNNTSNIRSFK